MPSKPVPGEVFSREDRPDLVGRKDAFHVAAILIDSDYVIYPGMPVIITGNTHKAVPKYDINHHGVADPFMEKPSIPGTLFWVFLDPQYVGDLTHTFDFPVNATAERSDDSDDEWPNQVLPPMGTNYCDFSKC